MEFPHVLSSPTQPELFIRDINFLNYHIGHDKADWFRDYQIPDAVRLEDDFFQIVSTQLWTTILTGGSGAAAVTDYQNGVLTLTTHSDATDAAEAYQTYESWRLYDHHPLYFEIRAKVTVGLTDLFYAGLGNANGEYAVGFADGVYFASDGDGNLDFKVENNTVVTSADTGINLANLTWYRLAFHWDGEGTIRYFVFDDDQVLLATGSVTAGFAQDEELGIAFGVKTPTGATSMYVDYVKCVQRRYIA